MSESGPRWTSLQSKGGKVVLVGREGEWALPTRMLTEEEAQHVVAELWAWSHASRELEDFKRLCVAG